MLTTVADRMFQALTGNAPADLLRSESRNFIRAMVADMGSIRAIWHPLGFVNIKVTVSPVNALRLHVWPSLNRSPVSASTQMHDHSWALTSFVVTGCLTNVMMDVTESQPEETTYRLTNISYDGAVNHLCPTSRHVKLAVLERVTYKVGDTYKIPPRFFHYTIVNDRPTVTVVAGTETPGRPRQVIERDKSASRSVTRKTIGVADLSLLMEEVSAFL